MCSSGCHVLLQACVAELAKSRRAGTASSSQLWKVAHSVMNLGCDMVETACLSSEGCDELEELCSSALQALQGGQAGAGGLWQHAARLGTHLKCSVSVKQGCMVSAARAHVSVTGCA